MVYKMINRDALKDKNRIVVKIGSSSLTHKETGLLDFVKLEKLVRVLTNLRNQGKEVILVSSGAIAVGRTKLLSRNRFLSKLKFIYRNIIIRLSSFKNTCFCFVRNTPAFMKSTFFELSI